MPDLIARLAKVIDKRLRTIGCPRPSLPLLRFLLETTYHATLRREEGNFIRGSVTFVDPRTQNSDGPQTRRAHYPAVWSFGKRSPLTVERLVKLSRAIDVWSGSVAAFGTTIADTYVWGVVDQMVQANMGRHLENDGEFSNPGLLEITMEGVGDLTIYHRGMFLGGVRGHQIVIRESDPLWAGAIGVRVLPHLIPLATAIAKIIPNLENGAAAEGELAFTWVNTVSRLCIGLRRLGTGGTFLITGVPHWDQLHIGERFEYRRLGDSMILSVLDKHYRDESSDIVHSYVDDPEGVPFLDVVESNLAGVDDSDRQKELTGAVKLVTSLASVDGLVLLSPLLHVQGFGVKISSAKQVQTVYDGEEFARRGTRAKKIGSPALSMVGGG